MGKKSGAKKYPSGVCGSCKNFRPAGKGGTGMCARKDKKRAADDKACGNYDKR